jgi:hypothetical protein
MPGVPEFDAFGREIGEDPLAALRDATAAAPRREVAAEAETPLVATPKPAEAAPAVVVSTPEPAEAAPRFAPPVAARPQFARRRVRRRGSVAGLIVVVAIFGAIGLGVTALVDRVDDFTSALPGLEQAEPPPTGLQARSLIRPPNLAAALELMRQSGYGRPATLRIAADRVDATLAGPSGIRQVQVTADRELRSLASTEPGTPLPTVPFRRIDPTAPQRLVRSADAPANRIDYVLLVPSRPLGWRAYFRDGTNVTGDRTGRPR